MTLKKIKWILVEGIIVNALLFFVLLIAGRGGTQFTKDVANVFSFLGKYCFGNYYSGKFLGIGCFVVLLAGLIVSIVFKVKKQKRKNFFGIELLLLVLFLGGISVVHRDDIGLLFNGGVTNKTTGLLIFISGVLTCLFVTVYAVLLTRDVIIQLNEENKAAKMEKARKLRQKERVEQLKKQFAEAKQLREQQEKQYEDFEIESSDVSKKEEVKEDKKPVEEAPKKPVKEEVKQEENKQSEVKENPAVEEAKPVEETQPVEATPEVTSSATSNEFEEDYSLTEEGYLPLDDVHKFPSFEPTFNASGNQIKESYSELKNLLLSYEKVSNVRNKTFDSYKVGKNTVVRIALFDKGMKIYLAIDPYTVDPNNFYQYDAFDKYEDTPTVVKVHSSNSLKRAKELVKIMFENVGVSANTEYIAKDYTVLEQIAK